MKTDNSKQMDLLVNAFLSWPLPETVASDTCVTVKGQSHRVGTNLLTANEAKQMFQHIFRTVGIDTNP